MCVRAEWNRGAEVNIVHLSRSVPNYDVVFSCRVQIDLDEL